MCKKECSTAIQLQEAKQEISRLKEKVHHYQSKSINFSTQLLKYKIDKQDPIETLSNLIEIATR